MTVNRRQLLTLAALGLAAAGAQAQTPSQPAPAVPGAPPGMDVKSMYEQFAEKGKGFDMKPGIAGRPTVYIAFDPQCPYCDQLWQEARPLAAQVRFVWLPVAVLNPHSEPQGAAILSAPDPVAMMERHEAAFRNVHRGLVTEGMAIPFSAREDVWNNSRIFRRTGGRSVPWGVFKNASGEFGVIRDAVKTDELKRILGLN